MIFLKILILFYKVGIMGQREIAKEIRFYYFYHFFSNLDFARGIFAIYLVSKGLTGAQIGTIQSILFLSSMFFELPTGFVADRYSKKLSIALGLGICALTPILILYSTSFVHFALCFVILGIGYSLTSGADTAILYDRLKEFGDEWILKYKMIIGRSRSFRYTALAIAVSCGGLLQALGWEYVFFSAAIGCLIAGAAILFVHEPTTVQSHTSEDKKTIIPWHELMELMRSHSGRSLFFLMLSIAFIQAATTPLFIYAQLMFKDFAFNNQTIGIIIALGLIVSSISYAHAYKIKIKNEIVFLVIIGAVIFCTLISFLLVSKGKILIVLYLLGQATPPVLAVHLSSVLNAEIPSEIRATCLSVQSLIQALVLSFANVVFGTLTDTFHVKFALGCLGVMPIISIFMFYIYGKMKNEINSQIN
jgi:MFS family permease